ncbi:uncharacterized protein IL334_003964 [Kwoniella shivajii]|uniref:NAD(P)-binding domain-containing protein n=1 Tax=Kwoniella shivajii TaxID=564305 RepID=A0ABZ1CZ13_9TREE|nr:hypothetical protein IL334_003964 [Kwoniella shivajii]
MSAKQSTFLVFGASGGTGKHFLTQALSSGHKVRALVRTPSKLAEVQPNGNLEIVEGSITDPSSFDMDALISDVDYVALMLGDKQAQATSKINTTFVKVLVPSMRKHGVKRILYQSGGLTRPHGGSLSVILWLLRYTIASGFEGQHQDNESVHEYFVTEANDMEWIIHRAGISGDTASKGTLERSPTTFSIANHVDCARYNYRTVMDDQAVRTCEFSKYAK